jgi:peptidyl-prolyl cis-trans isomerase C
VKIYPIFSALLISVAYAQTPAPKPAAPPKPGTPAQTNSATPGAPGPLAALDPDRVIATIGTEKITAAQFDAIIDGLPAQYQAQARGPAKRQFMEQLVQLKVLAHQALVMHIDESPQAKQQIAFARENILANMAGKAITENVKVDKDSLQKYYDEHKNDYEQVSAHHILIRFKGSPVPLKDGQKDLTEEEALAKAQDIEKRLKAGEDFGAIAKAESADAGSGANGGDLGSPFKRGQMVKAFEDAAFTMKVGEISDPVKTQFGYHIIRVDKIEVKSFDDVHADLENKVKPMLAKQKVDELQKEAGVKLEDSFFGPPTPMPPAGTPQAAK